MGRDLRMVRFSEIAPVEAGLEFQRTVAEQVTNQTATPLLVAWRCHPALLVSGSETRLPEFDKASAALDAAGWPVFVRRSGGAACPVGPGTLQVAMIEPASPNATMTAEYARLAEMIRTTLACFGVAAQIGCVPAAFCPGRFDVAVEGKKIAGLSQHWFRNRRGVRCLIVAASLNLEEPPDLLSRLVNQFYRIAGSPLGCEATALTNLILSAGATFGAGQDLAEAVVARFRDAARCDLSFPVKPGKSASPAQA